MNQIIIFFQKDWHLVKAHHRFINFYGEQSARLSRDQYIVNPPPQMTSFFRRTAFLILFNEPRYYANELRNLYVDDNVYAEPWSNFSSYCINQWKDVLYWVSTLIMFFLAAKLLIRQFDVVFGAYAVSFLYVHEEELCWIYYRFHMLSLNLCIGSSTLALVSLMVSVCGFLTSLVFMSQQVHNTDNSNLTDIVSKIIPVVDLYHK